MAEIRVFHTHIEVYPYYLGQAPKIEKMLSKYVKYPSGYAQYVPVGFYIKDNILYLPRGLNLSMLSLVFQANPTIMNEPDSFSKVRGIHMTSEPRDRIQEDSINFLLSKNEFSKGNFYSQYGLNLDTGDGKTYCMVNAIVNLKMKAIVIVHKKRIKEQWKKEFLDRTDISEDRIIDIDGSATINKIMNNKLSGDIYIVNHQTLHSYVKGGDDVDGPEDWTRLRKFFQKIKVGIKVVDEAHKFFTNTLFIDFFSNVSKSYYLTATFTRSDPAEVRIYKQAFASLYRFGEETLNYEEKRKHIILTVVYYHTYPNAYQLSSMVTAKGFSAYRFIDYEMNDANQTMLRVVRRILESTYNLRGKTLINSPKTDSVDQIAEYVHHYIDGKSVGTIHSKNSDEENKEHMMCDIISSTNKSLGEGDNIKDLRVLINTEPIGSKALSDQLRGRLREFSKEDDTFLFWLVDTSVKECYEFSQRIMPVMKKKCKEIKFMRMDDI